MTNRIVVLFSPIFVALAGWVVTLVAKYLPGHPHLDATGLAAIFIAGAVFAAAHVALWIRGWQKHEARVVPVKPQSAVHVAAQAAELHQVGTPAA